MKKDYRILTYAEWIQHGKPRAAWCGSQADPAKMARQCNEAQDEYHLWWTLCFLDAFRRDAYPAEWCDVCVADISRSPSNVDACYEAFISLQRSEGNPPQDVLTMTAHQLQLARAEWSRRLRELQQATHQKEHNRIVCDGILPDDLP